MGKRRDQLQERCNELGARRRRTNAPRRRQCRLTAPLLPPPPPAEQATAQLRGELQQARAQLDTSARELDAVRRAHADAESRKQELMEAEARQKRVYDRVAGASAPPPLPRPDLTRRAAELVRVEKELADSRAREEALQASVTESSSSLAPLQLELEKLRREHALVSNHNAWLESELQSKVRVGCGARSRGRGASLTHLRTHALTRARPARPAARRTSC